MRGRAGVVEQHEEADGLRDTDGLQVGVLVQQSARRGLQRVEVDISLAQLGDERFEWNGGGALLDEGERVRGDAGPEEGDLLQP